MKKGVPITKQTMSELLDQDLYVDLYDDVLNEDKRYYVRPDTNNRLDIVISFHTIDEFSRDFRETCQLDFQSYRDRFLLIAWTSSDPKNPLGFPIQFDMTSQEDYEIIDAFLDQEDVFVHYLSTDEDLLIHVYSEVISLSGADKKLARSVIAAMNRSIPPDLLEDESYLPKNANLLTDEQLQQGALGFCLDYSSLVRKYGEAAAEEKTLSALMQALAATKRHPRAKAREASFLIWVNENTGRTIKGEEAVLLTVYISPPMKDVFELVHDRDQEENPFTKAFLSFPEYLAVVEAKPVHRGAFPLIEYDKGQIFSLEIDEFFQSRLRALCPLEDNPYDE
jgi:hypothetical protein